MKTMVAGEKISVNLPVTVSGYALSCIILGSEKIFHEPDWKIFSLNIRSDIYNLTDRGPGLIGTGQ